MTLLITNATLVTLTDSGLLENHAVYIEGDKIKAIGLSAKLQAQYPHVETIDADGSLLMPGSICAHTHFYGAYARGMAIPGPAPK
ncbi:MAG: hydrolase, partial [Anaerolineae bacterium]